MHGHDAVQSRTGKSMSTAQVRVLVLEDEQEIAKLVARLLEREGYAVTCVGDGKAGLEAAASGDFDLCLLNVILPNLDGFTIAEQLRKRNIELPLIFLTATPRDEVVAKVASLGLRIGYVPKPSSRSQLIGKVSEILEGKGWLEFDGN